MSATQETVSLGDNEKRSRVSPEGHTEALKARIRVERKGDRNGHSELARDRNKIPRNCL